ncbi:MAG: hypothetical protein ACO3EZ_16350 [Prochlorotrichaceae cyanobacterium]|jgi:hypothetical protein
MTNLIKFDGFDDSEIRITDDDRYSVLDLIKFCGQKNPRQVWKRLTERFSEVVTKCDSYKFPGKGQQETPVANRQNILYIIGLLPGAVGRAYREESAKVFLQYLEASPELAESVIDRATPEDLKRIQKRLAGKKIRVQFATELYDRGVTEGWQIASCTNEIYKPLLGGTAKEVRENRNLPVKSNIRDSMDSLELASVMFAEELATRDMKAKNAHGYPECKDITANAANKVRSVLDAD